VTLSLRPQQRSLMLPWSAEVCLHRLGQHGIFPDNAV
jgi:hypothetical protein